MEKVNKSEKKKVAHRSFQPSWSSHPFLLIMLTGIVLFFLGSIIFILTSSQNNTSHVVAPSSKLSLTNPYVASLNASQYACKKISVQNMWETYDCSFFSIMLPKGWMYGHGEFTNYDVNTAPGRDYSPSLDKGKVKIGISLTNTTLPLLEFAKKLAQERGDTIVSVMPLTINNNLAMKTSRSTQYSPTQPITTVYIQNSSKTTIADITFVLGFDNIQSLTDQIFSTFQFAK